MKRSGSTKRNRSVFNCGLSSRTVIDNNCARLEHFRGRSRRFLSRVTMRTLGQPYPS